MQRRLEMPYSNLLNLGANPETLAEQHSPDRK